MPLLLTASFNLLKTLSKKFTLSKTSFNFPFTLTAIVSILTLKNILFSYLTLCVVEIWLSSIMSLLCPFLKILSLILITLIRQAL